MCRYCHIEQYVLVLRAVHTYTSRCCAALVKNVNCVLHWVTISRAATHSSAQRSSAQRVCERPINVNSKPTLASEG